MLAAALVTALAAVLWTAQAAALVTASAAVLWTALAAALMIAASAAAPVLAADRNSFLLVLARNLTSFLLVPASEKNSLHFRAVLR